MVSGVFAEGAGDANAIKAAFKSMNPAFFLNPPRAPSSRTWGKLRGACHRVSLTALLLSACGEQGTSNPIQAGQILSGASSSMDMPATSTLGNTDPSLVSGALAGTSPEIIVGEPPAVQPPCEQATGEAETLVFGASSVAYPVPTLSDRTLYSWTTLEQAQELLEGTPLLNRAERPGLGPGYAIEYLSTEFYPQTETDAAIIELLTTERFTRARYAWPHAWATRMGWPATEQAPAETYGDQLLQIVVKPEALWIVVSDSRLWVVDNEGVESEPTVATEQPERIAGVFFSKDANTGGASCGTFGASAFSAYREFILMNPDMIESWSLGTDEIRSVVHLDVERLTALFHAIRSCPNTQAFDDWAGFVVCRDWANSGTELSAYESALALMSPHYQPRPAEISAIVETLEADLARWTIEIPATPSVSNVASVDGGPGVRTGADASLSKLDEDAGVTQP